MQDPLLLEKWAIAIGRWDKVLQPNIHFVCERHFEEHCLYRYCEIVLPDGMICRVKRSRTVLKSNAVPSIFPYSTMEKQYGKSSHLTEERTIVYREMSFGELKYKLTSLPLPNERWFLASVDQSMVLFKVNSDQDIEKEVVISEDLTLNVMDSKYMKKNVPIKIIFYRFL